MEIDEPNLKLSATDKFYTEPKATIPIIDAVEPNRTCSRILHEEPIVTKSYAEVPPYLYGALPAVTLPLIETTLP